MKLKISDIVVHIHSRNYQSYLKMNVLKDAFLVILGEIGM